MMRCKTTAFILFTICQLFALQNWYNTDTRLQKEYQFYRSEMRQPGNDTVLGYLKFETDSQSHITTHQQFTIGSETGGKKYGHQYDENGYWLRELTIDGIDTTIQSERIFTSDSLWTIQVYDSDMNVTNTISQVYENGLLKEERSANSSNVTTFTYTAFHKMSTETSIDTTNDSTTFFAEYIYEDELLIMDSLNWGDFQYKHIYSYEQGRVVQTEVFEDGVNSMILSHLYKEESTENLYTPTGTKLFIASR